MSEETDLSSRLQTVIDEIRDVMEKRKERIEELRQEIADIERDNEELERTIAELLGCLLYTSPSPRDLSTSRMPSSA